MTGREYIKSQLAHGKKICRDGWKWAKENGLMDKSASEAWDLALEQGVVHLLWISDGAITDPVIRDMISFRLKEYQVKDPVTQEQIKMVFDGIVNPFREA